MVNHYQSKLIGSHDFSPYKNPSAKATVIDPGDEAPFLV
jgi:hypothetical protein